MSIEVMRRVVAAFDAPDGMPEFCKAIDDMRQAIAEAEQQEHIIDCPRCGHCCPGTAEQAPICAHGVSKIKCDFCKQAEQEQPTRAEKMREAGYTRRSTLREFPREDEQAEQAQPVAWMMINHTHLPNSKSLHWTPQTDWHVTWEAVPLYTAPPPHKPWVGLTAKEKKEIERLSVYVDGAIRLTESKLKEKNT